MNRNLMVWPRSGTGEHLAGHLENAANLATSLNGPSAEMPDLYLGWASDQLEFLEPLVRSADLDRLIGNRRYWATLSNPEPTRPTLKGVHGEIRRATKHLRDTATEVRKVAEGWSLSERSGSYLFVDTNVWLDRDTSIEAFDWHSLVENHKGPGRIDGGAELRLVIPTLLIDEFDDVSHKSGEVRWKASGFARFFYELLGDADGTAREVKPESQRGKVTAQLLLDPLHHTPVPNHDDELVDRFATLRDFVGHDPARWWYITGDSGAALRAASAGLNTRLVPKPKRVKAPQPTS